MVRHRRRHLVTGNKAIIIATGLAPCMHYNTGIYFIELNRIQLHDRLGWH